MAPDPEPEARSRKRLHIAAETCVLPQLNNTFPSEQEVIRTAQEPRSAEHQPGELVALAYHQCEASNEFQRQDAIRQFCPPGVALSADQFRMVSIGSDPTWQQTTMTCSAFGRPYSAAINPYTLTGPQQTLTGYEYYSLAREAEQATRAELLQLAQERVQTQVTVDSSPHSTQDCVDTLRESRDAAAIGQESIQEPHSDEADSTHTQPGYHCGNGGYPEGAVLATSGMLCGSTATPADRNLLSYITLALQAFLPGSCSSGSGSVSVKHDPEASGCIYTTLITVAFALALALYQQLHIECLNQDSPICISVNWSREHENRDAMLKTLAGVSLVGSIVCWCKVVLGTQASERPDSDRALAFAPRFYLCMLPLSALQNMTTEQTVAALTTDSVATGFWADRLVVLSVYAFYLFISMFRESTHILRILRVLWYVVIPCRVALGTLAVLSMPTFVPLSISGPFLGACLYQTQTEHLADMLFVGAVVLCCAETTLACFTFIAATLMSICVRVLVVGPFNDPLLVNK